MATRVEEISDGASTAAWLYDFNVGSATLHTEHQQWLDRKIVAALAGEQSRNAGRTTSTGHAWQIWAVGGTSRTGSVASNLELSKRRAEAVRAYLGRRMNGFNVVWSVAVSPWGELRAMLAGRADETENKRDRSAYVVMQKVTQLQPQPALPPVPRPKRVDVSNFKLEFPTPDKLSEQINRDFTVVDQGLGLVGLVADLAGAEAAAFGLGLLSVGSAWVGLWLNMGLPYLEAKENKFQSGLDEGFSVGFAAGLFELNAQSVSSMFSRKGMPRAGEDFYHADGKNKGLALGWVVAWKLSPAKREALRARLTAKLRPGQADQLFADHTSWETFLYAYASLVKQHLRK